MPGAKPTLAEGANDLHEWQDAKRIRLTDQIATIAALLLVVWIAAIFLIGDTWIYAIWDFTVVIGMCLVRVLNRRGFHFSARWLLLLIANGLIFVYASLFSGRAGTHYCFFPMVALPIALFSSSNRVSIALGVLLPASLFILLDFTDYRLFPPFQEIPIKSWYYWMTVVTAFFLSFAWPYYFRRANEKSERELRKSQNRFSKMVEAMQEGICVMDEEGKITYFNPALARMLGADLRQSVGRPALELVLPSHRERAALAFGGRRANVLERFELNFVRPDGKEVITWVSITHIDDGNSENKPVIALILDITEARDRERIIDQQRGAMLLSAKLSALGEMAAGIGHEINNPLTALRLGTGMILRLLGSQPPNPGEAIVVAEKMESTIQRITRIIDGLKTFSREDEKSPMSEASVRDIIEDTLSFCQERFRVSGITLDVPDTPRSLRIHCRPVQISQVLLNLLSNSLHAVSGHPGARVSIQVTELADAVEISVTDNGVGIPEDMTDRIFQPFFTTKPPGVGTGLGLSISKGIVESHGGSIGFHCDPGRTTFWFRIPKR